MRSSMRRKSARFAIGSADRRALSGLTAPIGVYRGKGTVYLFDLTRPLHEHAATMTVVEMFETPECVPPAPRAPFDL